MVNPDPDSVGSRRSIGSEILYIEGNPSPVGEGRSDDEIMRELNPGYEPVFECGCSRSTRFVWCRDHGGLDAEAGCCGC